jgi:hypothetical protein
MLNRMRPDIRADWTEALRTGQVDGDPVHQGFGSLLDADGGFCCLGVLGCVLTTKYRDVLEQTGWAFYADSGTFVRTMDSPEVEDVGQDNAHYELLEGSEITTEIPEDLADAIGLVTGNGRNPTHLGEQCLVEINDSHTVGFPEIADLIDADF